VRQIARLLQAKAPENHMLAYITPEEAQFLKARGGSGMPDAETGVPTFAPAYDYGDTGTQADYTPPPILQDAQLFDPTFEGRVNSQKTMLPAIGQAPLLNAYREGQREQQQAAVFPDVPYYSMGDASYGMQPGARPFAQQYSEGQGFEVNPNLLYRAPELPTTIRIPEIEPSQAPKGAEDLNIMQRLSKFTGMNEQALARLGLAGIQTVIGAQASKKAAEQGQRGRAETQALAAPYQAKGAELQRQAQSGELTPVARQQLQAIQAQVAQSASARGGVGAQQSAARVEAIRNQLLQQQNDYGMKLTSIGDQIALGAIRTGLQADQFANQLTSNYFTNIMRTLAGTPTVIQYGAPQ